MLDDLKLSELRKANVKRCEKHYHLVTDWSLADWMTAVTSEVGELANEIKAIRRRQTESHASGHTIRGDRADMAEEAADIIIYLDLLCAREGIDLGKAVRDKFNKVSLERLVCPECVLENE